MPTPPHPGAGGYAGLGTVLGVWAHPEDAAFLSGGLMMLARETGNRVVVVTATRGEPGAAWESTGATRWPPERLARLRSDELAASLAILGVAEHRWLDYTGGNCAEASKAGGCARLRRLIREVAPDTVLTFAPELAAGSGDHQAVCAWTTEAWVTSGCPARLLYATARGPVAAEFADLYAHYAVLRAGLRSPTPAESLAVHLRLEGAALERKLAALRVHASRLPLPPGVGRERFGAWCSEEAFRTGGERSSRQARRL